MFRTMNSTLFLITVLPFILCASNTTRSKNGFDVAYKFEDIFGSNLTRLPPTPSKIDLYVNNWIRKILEANKIGSPGDFKNGSSFPPVARDRYFIGMKWMIKKYCFNVSSNTACMQVVLKPHEDEEVPLKLRLFWRATDSDSTVKHLGKKQIFKGSDSGKLKKKYHKDDKYYKSRNAFDQFYKHLSNRKMELLQSPEKAENGNSTKILPEKSLLGAMSQPLAHPVSKNPNRRVTHRTNTKRKSIKETLTTLSDIIENGPVPEIAVDKIIHDSFKKEISIIDNEEEAERSENEEDENEIKERIKRAAKKGKNAKKSTKAATKKPPATKKPKVTKPNKTTKLEEYEGDDEEEEDDDEEEEDDDEEDEEEEEAEEEYEEAKEELRGGDAGILINPNQYPVVIAQGDVRLAEHHAGDSSAADTSEEHDGPMQGVGVNYYDPAPVPYEDQAFYYAHDTGPVQGQVGADHDAHHGGSFFAGAPDWNRCQLPPPRKTSEVLCKVLPHKMVCKLYCIHGHTFPEGIIRETDCELVRGAWSKKFDECLPFVDCTLRLRTAGYLKCTTNTVQVGPRCQVECQKYADQAATEKLTHQCDATGRWDPPLPHCVVREGIDVVQPPSTMHQGKMDYPQ